MKKLNKDFELLSAYLDGELSAEEVRQLEQKIKLSKELQDKLAEYEKLKLLNNQAFTKLDESPYFETRLTASINSENTVQSKIRKWIPAFGFSILTISLMLLLKFNPSVIDNIVEEQTTNLAGFYKENLQPILADVGLSNEDVFNFAFYGHLPLNKENNQYLYLGSSGRNKEFFEIKNMPEPEENNLENFAAALNLNEFEKKKMDSILQSYADEMQEQVLINDKNTVAINPNLWNYNKAIFADIIAFAETINKKELNKIIPSGYAFYDKQKIDRIVKEVKSRKEDEYIFLTPDTVFTEEFAFNSDEFRNEMEKMKTELKKSLEGSKEELKKMHIAFNFDKKIAGRNKGKDYFVSVDSNSCRVQLNKVDIPRIEFPDFDSIAAHIENAMKHIGSFTFNMNPKTNSFNFKMEGNNQKENFSFRMNLPNPDSIEHFFKNKNWFINPDSLRSFIEMFVNDSLIVFDKEEMQEQMKEMEREMKKFKMDMDRLKKDINKDTVIEKRKGIEI